MLAYVEPFAPPLRRSRPSTRAGPAVYRRRRLAVALLLGLAAIAVATVALVLVPRLAAPGADGIVTVSAGPWSESPAPTAGVGDVPTGPTTYVVRPGDTVWSIAESLDPSGDVRATVHRIVEANGGSTLVVGQRIEISPSS